MNRFLIFIFIAVLTFNIYWAIDKALKAYDNDFAASYYAASVILDPSLPSSAMYDLNTMHNIYPKYGIDKPVDYIYSMAAAYLHVPFALLPYQIAKIVWNLIGLIIYLISVILILQLEKVNCQRCIEYLTISMIWFPFLFSQYFNQSNAVILFFLSLAILAASKERPYLSGVLISVASLFKLFPVAVALVFGLKNWRILAMFSLGFILSLLTPGSLEWFSSIRVIFPRYSSIYLLLNRLGICWYYLYVAAIVCATAVVAYRAKAASYLQLAALAITAVFLVMPLIQYHHLTVLVISFAYLISVIKSLSRSLIYLTILAFFMINFYINFSLQLIPAVGLFLVWSVLITMIIQEDKQVVRIDCL